MQPLVTVIERFLLVWEDFSKDQHEAENLEIGIERLSLLFCTK